MGLGKYLGCGTTKAQEIHVILLHSRQRTARFFSDDFSNGAGSRAEQSLLTGICSLRSHIPCRLRRGRSNAKKKTGH